MKPYVRRNKNDAVDAAAICEAGGQTIGDPEASLHLRNARTPPSDDSSPPLEFGRHGLAAHR